MKTIDKRIGRLEGKLGIDRQDGWLYPDETFLDRWKEARTQGLHVDVATGDLITLEELHQRDPDRSALFCKRMAQIDALDENEQLEVDNEINRIP